MDIKTNPLIDKYLMDGCMRCPYGATPQCKVNFWKNELELLRQIALKSGLKEELKWSVPVYTHQGKNIISINALKASANLSFFKGALLKDSHQILEQQGNIQSGRIIRFTTTDRILQLQDILQSYIQEAIAVEESGSKMVVNTKLPPLPKELLDAFEEDPHFKKAFYALTPGRQRGYIIHFSQAQQPATRISRIMRYKEQIFLGKGMHDDYKQRK